MKAKRSIGDNIFDTANVIFMIIFAALMVLPMWHVFCLSFSDGAETLKGGFFFYVKGFNLKGYQTIFNDDLVLRTYLNTIIYALSHTLLVLFFTSMTAYPLSIPDFILKKSFTIYITITMFIGGGMIPTYMLMRNLHITNTIWVMIIPFCVGTYNVILFRTFFTGLPCALREAAIIDGANEFTVFFQFFVPLSKPIFATIALFTIVGKWNDWFSALIYLNSENMYPFQMILRKVLFNANSVETKDPLTIAMLQTNEVTSQNIKMAAIVISIVPILCIYPFIQKYFVKGIFVGSIKG